MREIKFRGINMEGQWVYGYLGKDWDNEVSITTIFDSDVLYHCEYKVFPESVGQYTGLKDKNGREIYEGDIAKSGKRLFVAKWNNDIASFVWGPLDGESSYPCFNVGTVKNVEIVGNIYENPELLEGEE